MCTSVIGEAASVSYTLGGTSVGSRSSACLPSMRATSRATLPLPITATSLCVQRPVPRNIGVAVVPADEFGGAEAAGQLGSGDVQRRRLHRAGREDDRVVVPLQVVQGEVDAVPHVAEQPDVAAVEHRPQRRHDALDPRMVRGHAVPHQAERGG